MGIGGAKPLEDDEEEGDFLWSWDLGRTQVPLCLGCGARLLGKVVMIVMSIEQLSMVS